MHPIDLPEGDSAPESRGPWYKLLTRYHWFVFFVAALGWLFDCLDQQLFILARPSAMEELISEEEFSSEAVAQARQEQEEYADLSDEEIRAKLVDRSRKAWGDYATSIFILGWATGGLIFGMLGDRIGRARTMILTILLYSMFTGLSSLSTTVWDFALYRFLTGLGVGGEFAVGVALVAEVMPAPARTYTLGLLQALSAVGNISAAFINMGLGLAAEQGMVESPWRIMFLIGAVPALLALVIRRRLKEPEKWQQVSTDDAVTQQLGSYKELFGNPTFRKHALLGLVLGSAGMIGLWTVGFFTMDLIRFVQRKPTTLQFYAAEIEQAQAGDNPERVAHLESLIAYTKDPESAAPLEPEAQKIQAELEPIINGRLLQWSSYVSLAINIGAAFGMFGFGALAQRIGRKPTFVLALLSAYATTVATFWFLQDMWQVWVMVPVMGFCQLSLFAGYAIYFPELFPTRLRATGTSFCYNVARYAVAAGLFIKPIIAQAFTGSEGERLRYAGISMCTVFLIGLLVLPFLPETKDAPLPD